MTTARKRPIRAFLLAGWLVLLAASHVQRVVAPDGGGDPGGARIIEVPECGRGADPSRLVRLAFADSGPAGPVGAPVVLLLHGSPGDRRTFDRLAPLLARQHRVLVPDLPGFGDSSSRIPDYSIEAHGEYLAAFLDRTGVGRAHVVGYSMGGGAALHLARLRPGATASLTLLSSVGVQEHELLGDYTLNHAVHAAQLGAIRLVDLTLPHFGRLDDALLSVSYARNFYDSDQRPLRGILEDWQGPMLVMHGVRDRLVPLSAAEEHLRIVPQSRGFLFDGGHLAVFTRPEDLVEPLERFMADVEAGAVPGRGGAEAGRVRAAAAPAAPRRLDRTAGGFALATGLLAFATFVSEDLTCLSAGLLAAKGSLSFVTACLACLLGIFVGDMLLFYAGRWFGAAALHRAPLRWFIDPAQVEQARGFFERRTGAVIFATRFVPGTRLATYFAAGLTGTPPGRFARWFLLAAAVWTPLLVGASMLIGQTVLRFFERYEGMALWGLAAAGLVFLGAIRLVVPLFSWKGRRLLLSRWRRLTRWEFWPAWMLYPPVAIHIARLALRHRSLTLFTAANPAIPCGGLVLESKSEILRGLEASGAVAPFRLIPAALPLDARNASLHAFLEESESGFPVVLKPDVGERGQGVAVLPDPAAARAFLAGCPEDVIAQKFVEGPEFGVFYFRHPDSPTGRVLSITEKHLVSVTGDGESTLEQLILADDRAVCMAPYFLERHRRHLHEVPQRGEAIRLTQLGTHCRGALFLDGEDHLTPELEASIDRIAKAFDGFYFGRFDIRAPSVSAFRGGRDLAVLELNGVTSESTNIYDPSHSIWFAWRQLMRQWTICFEIARRNAERGAAPAPIAEIVDRVRRFRRKDVFEAPGASDTVGAGLGAA